MATVKKFPWALYQDFHVICLAAFVATVVAIPVETSGRIPILLMSVALIVCLIDVAMLLVWKDNGRRDCTKGFVISGVVLAAFGLALFVSSTHLAFLLVESDLAGGIIIIIAAEIVVVMTVVLVHWSLLRLAWKP